MAAAQSTADIIAQLQAQIAALSAQLAALQTGAGAGAAVGLPGTNLTLGSRGDGVKALQGKLIADSKGPAAAALAAVGATGYFGGLTKSALAEWQAAMNVSPAAGYYGPLTRAAMGASGGAVVRPGVPAAAGTLAVSLAPDSPSGSAIAGAGQIEVTKFNVTASAAAGATIKEMIFSKVGVVSDTNVSNLYLRDKSNQDIVAQYTSLSKGKATFGGTNLQVNAGQTKTYALVMDLSSSATAGNTLGWELTSLMADGATVVGAPVAGKTLTVTTVSNPSIAGATYTYVAVGTTIDAGSSNVLLHQATLNITNSAVSLNSIKYTMVGSANKAHLTNLKLKIAGNEVASTVQGGDTVVFTPTTPVTVNTGNNTIEVYADVTGSPNRTVAVNLLQGYHLNIADTTYNTGITTTLSGSATTVTINVGRVTLSLSGSTPSGNVPNGASNVTLTKANLFAGSEGVKIRFMDVAIQQGSAGDTWATLANLTEDIEQVKVMDDAGGQMGSSIATIAAGTGNGQCTLTSATTTTCHFGTSGSPINYVVPANTSRVLSVMVNILSTNDAPTLRANFNAGTDNGEGLVSLDATIDTGAVTGVTLTVVTSPLTVGLNTGFTTQTYVAGSNNAKIASFTLTASSAESINVSSVTIDKDDNSGSGSEDFSIQNLLIKVGTTQFGTTRAIVSDTATETITFSGASKINIPAGGSVSLDAFADIRSSASAVTYTAPIDLTDGTAVGGTSQSSITWPATDTSGQNVTIASGPTLTIAIDSNTKPARQVVFGSTANSLASYRFSANNTEDIRVTDVTFNDTITNGTANIASIKNLEFFDGNTKLAGPLNLTMPGATTASVAFSMGTNSQVIIPKNSAKTLELRGDVPTLSEIGTGASNDQHQFGIMPNSNVTALGKDSSASATLSGTATGNVMTVLQTKLTLASSLLGAATGRTRVAVDDVATINWTADAADQLTMGTVALKFSGLAVSNGSTAFGVRIIDSATNSDWGSSASTNCTPGSGNSCSVTLGPAFIISKGTTKATKVRVNSTNFFNGANTSDSMSVTIDAAGDVAWNDGTTAALSLEATVAPFVVVNVSYE